MFKKLFIISTACLMSVTAVAQTPFFQPPKKSQVATQTPLPPINGTIVSPSDFSGQVSQINTQKQATFKNQMNQKISQQAAPKVKEPAPNMLPSQPVQETTTSQPTIETPTPQDTFTAPTPQQQTVAPKPTPPPAPAPSTSISNPASQPSQPYTGFQNNNTQTGNQPKNGGWNVKY